MKICVFCMPLVTTYAWLSTCKTADINLGFVKLVGWSWKGVWGGGWKLQQLFLLTSDCKLAFH